MRKLILIMAIGLFFFACQNNKQAKKEASQDTQEIKPEWLGNWFMTEEINNEPPTACMLQ